MQSNFPRLMSSGLDEDSSQSQVNIQPDATQPREKLAFTHAPVEVPRGDFWRHQLRGIFVPPAPTQVLSKEAKE
jgi:hypothetical protein